MFYDVFNEKKAKELTLQYITHTRAAKIIIRIYVLNYNFNRQWTNWERIHLYIAHFSLEFRGTSPRNTFPSKSSLEKSLKTVHTSHVFKNKIKMFSRAMMLRPLYWLAQRLLIKVWRESKFNSSQQIFIERLEQASLNYVHIELLKVADWEVFTLTISKTKRVNFL